MRKILMSLLVVTIALFGCADKKTGGSISLSATTGGSSTIIKKGRLSARTQATMLITDFQIQIRDVVFKLKSSGSNDTLSLGFRGPYQLDLRTETDAVQATIGNANVPNNTYEAVRFKFHKSRNLPANHPLFDRSIYMKGTIDGKPFEMWHDTSENFDIAEKSGGVTVSDNALNIKIVFNMQQFLASEVSINLSSATDKDGDGLIEINPGSGSDNTTLADQLKRNIKAAAELVK